MIDLWRWELFIGCIAFSVFIPWTFRARIGLAGVALWSYSLLSALSVFMNPVARYAGIAKELDQTTGQAFCLLLLIPLGVLMIPPRAFRRWRGIAVILVIVESLLVLNGGYGVQAANTFDTALIAALFPLLRWSFALLGFAAICSCPGATAFVILASQYLPSIRRRTFVSGALAISLIVGVGYYFQGSDLYRSGDRLVQWGRFFEWWTANEKQALGTGIGTFQWIGPSIQGMTGNNLYVNMHADWLQMLFEGGVIGLVLLAWFYLSLVFKSARKRRSLALVLGFGAFMLTYHPLHFFVSSLVAACVARESLESGLIPTSSF